MGGINLEKQFKNNFYTPNCTQIIKKLGQICLFCRLNQNRRTAQTKGITREYENAVTPGSHWNFDMRCTCPRIEIRIRKIHKYLFVLLYFLNVPLIPESYNQKRDDRFSNLDFLKYIVYYCESVSKIPNYLDLRGDTT